MSHSDKPITLEVRKGEKRTRETLVSRMRNNKVKVYYEGRWLAVRVDNGTCYIKA